MSDERSREPVTWNDTVIRWVSWDENLKRWILAAQSQTR